MRQLNIRIRQVESETSKVLNTFSFLFLKNKMNCITLRPNPSLLVYQKVIKCYVKSFGFKLLFINLYR